MVLNDIPATRAEIRAAAGQCIMCGLPGPSVESEARELLRESQALGVILFARNVESPQQVAELSAELKALRPEAPLLVSVDQEGGRVARIRAPATEWPAPAQLGLLDDLALTRRVAAALGSELRAMNIDVTYAPVLDVNTNPNNPVIGDRAFGASVHAVAEHGKAFIAGLQQASVGAVGKHFPGHGDTDVDSHFALPKVGHELPLLREREWAPFRESIKAGLDAVMTAHVLVEALDETRPATLSRPVLRHLREELGFSGVIISDDVEMKALADHFSVSQMAEGGINAGVDIFLACDRPEVTLELYASLVRAVESGRLTKRQLFGAARRATAWRSRNCRAAQMWGQTQHWVGHQSHQALSESITTRLQKGV